MSKMNVHQYQAVHYVDGPLLVLAGAGSGKTTVITRKISYLIQTCKIKPENILAVTFTNKAAKEMKKRVASLLKNTSIKTLNISTFHTLGLSILREEYSHLGLKYNFTLLDNLDCQKLLAELIKETSHAAPNSPENLQYIISRWKNDSISPQDAKKYIFNEQDEFSAMIYEKYEKTLHTYKAVDFDDLILKPVLLFKTQPKILERWQMKIHYLLVDEYQDTNGSQYQLIKQLIGMRSQFTLVGDDDQSIYAWRGARPENIDQLQQDYLGLKVIKLEQNYRSTKTILHVANTLIANNPHVFLKKLWSDRNSTDKVRVIRCKNEEAEAERIVAEIFTHHIKTGCDYKNYAILYRGNHQSRLLEIKLQTHQIPYNITGGTPFFSRTEIKDIIAYMRLIVNYEDDNAFLRIINTPHRGIGPNTLKKVAKCADEQAISLFKACSTVALSHSLDHRYLEKLLHFTHQINSFSKLTNDSNNIVNSLKEIINTIGYEQWLVQEYKDNRAAVSKRMVNIEFLLSSIESMQDYADDELPLSDIVTKLTLKSFLDQQEESNENNNVQLMTLHASKGLEFPHVYLVNLEENILPHRNSIEEDNIEEERRLMYVGITRAQKTLTLSLSEKRRQFGELVHSEPSRFIQELPEESLDFIGWENKKMLSTEEKKLLGKTAMKNIRAQLLNDF